MASLYAGRWSCRGQSGSGDLSRDQLAKFVREPGLHLVRRVVQRQHGVHETTDRIVQAALALALRQPLALRRDEQAQALARFQWRCSLSTWLGVLTRRRAGKLLRSQARAPERMESSLQPVGDHATPSEVASGHELEEAVRAGLDELAPRDRLALLLYYESGKSYRDVAAVLGVPPKHVASLMARARAKLARVLETQAG